MKLSHLATFAALMAWLCSVSCADCTGVSSPALSESEFADPPMQYRPVPLWFWNNTEVDKDGIFSQLHGMVEKDGYGGCAILPFGRNFRPEYLGDDYMALYRFAVDVADSLGARMSLYDEYGFPSGSMGFSNGDGVPRFRDAHPDRTIKRLDRHEIPVVAGKTADIDLNALEGKLMAVAAYDSIGHASVSLSGYVEDGSLCWTAPSDGGWKVMVFECVTDGKPRVDYLDPEATCCFIKDTHDKYYDAFGDRFGRVITSTFFDEPTMYYAQGRMWTPRFNEEFIARYGMEPDEFYPALWYDIGERTAAARNMMFGLHSSLYSEGFMKPVAEWAEAHGIQSTGHQDQEEIANTTCTSGDLMLDGKYMTVPGIDKIGGDRPAELFYKVISSSANNWDKAGVMSETYGAMGNIPVTELYRIAIEQYSKGITNLIPHAVWYDDSNVTFLPELSWRNPLYRDALPDFNKFLSRLRYVLDRPGRHVADIAILYPVQSQYAGHVFDGGLGPVRGSVEVPDTDYPEVSRLLTDEMGKDFTYLHPEVLETKCELVRGGDVTVLRMDNEVNWEKYRVLVLPGVKVISPGNMEKVRKAWERGVRVVFTTCMPCFSSEFGVDDAVIRDMAESMLAESGTRRKAVFVPEPSLHSLADALEGIDYDIEFLSEGEPFNYIHKVVFDTDVFFIGNIDAETRSHKLSLRGSYRSVRIMDPHTGVCCDAESQVKGGRTMVRVQLQPGQSVILAAM